MNVVTGTWSHNGAERAGFTRPGSEPAERGITPPVPPRPGAEVSAGQIIAGLGQLIAQAHARGLKIFGATLLPFLGAGYYSAAGEAKREAVNHWIRTGGAFDGIVDFDAVMRSGRPAAAEPRL